MPTHNCFSRISEHREANNYMRKADRERSNLFFPKENREQENRLSFKERSKNLEKGESRTPKSENRERARKSPLGRPDRGARQAVRLSAGWQSRAFIEQLRIRWTSGGCCVRLSSTVPFPNLSIRSIHI